MTTQPTPVLAAIHERRSIRKFTDESVSRDDMLRILDAGRWAPTGKNNQPLKFQVLFAGDERKKTVASRTKYTAMLENAAALICVFLDNTLTYDTRKDHQSAGACLQNILLAAHSLGYGAVWIGEILAREKEVLADLGLDAERYELQAVVAMGRPAAKGASSRRDFSEFLLEQF
ncbi:MAG: nitroreductase family protein [Desulfovibrionaceae bacterium]|jgi:nitroreductase|nr:nitroreductase family protein [Desulfovibrionaceae bacterium]